jgi:hypothetical protein
MIVNIFSGPDFKYNILERERERERERGKGIRGFWMRLGGK